MSVHEGRRCGPGGDPGPRRKRNVAEPGVSISRSTYHELGTSNAQFHGTHKAKPVRCGVVPASAAEACSKRAVAEPQSRIMTLNLDQSNRSGVGSSRQNSCSGATQSESELQPSGFSWSFPVSCTVPYLGTSNSQTRCQPTHAATSEARQNSLLDW